MEASTAISRRWGYEKAILGSMRQHEALDLLTSHCMVDGRVNDSEFPDQFAPFGRQQTQRHHYSAPVGLLVGPESDSRVVGEGNELGTPGEI